MFETGAKRWVVWLPRCKFELMLTITWACVDVLSAHTVKTHKKQNPPCLPKAQTFYSHCARDSSKNEKKMQQQKIKYFWIRDFPSISEILDVVSFLAPSFGNWTFQSGYLLAWTLGQKNITQMGCSQNWRKPLHCIETRFFFGLC